MRNQVYENQRFSNALKRQSLLEPRKQEFSLVQQVEHPQVLNKFNTFTNLQ